MGCGVSLQKEPDREGRPEDRKRVNSHNVPLSLDVESGEDADSETELGLTHIRNSPCATRPQVSARSSSSVDMTTWLTAFVLGKKKESAVAGPNTVYRIDVRNDDVFWVVEKRGVEFVTLRDTLVHGHPHASLPDLKDFSVEELNVFLQSLTSQPSLVADALTMIFLEMLSVANIDHHVYTCGADHDDVDMDDEAYLLKLDRVEVTHLEDIVESGDVILYRSTHFGSWITKTVTSSKWDHCGIVVKFADQKKHLFVLESTTVDGVMSYPLLFRLLAYRLDNGKEFALRRLRGPRPKELQQRLEDFVVEVEGRPFTKNIGDLIRAVFKQDQTLARMISKSESQKKSFFCSELVALAYQHMGVLTYDMPANEYLPKDFSSSKSSRLTLTPPWELQKEISIEIDWVAAKLELEGISEIPKRTREKVEDKIDKELQRETTLRNSLTPTSDRPSHLSGYGVFTPVQASRSSIPFPIPPSPDLVGEGAVEGEEDDEATTLSVAAAVDGEGGKSYCTLVPSPEPLGDTGGTPPEEGGEQEGGKQEEGEQGKDHEAATTAIPGEPDGKTEKRENVATGTAVDGRRKTETPATTAEGVDANGKGPAYAEVVKKPQDGTGLDDKGGEARGDTDDQKRGIRGDEEGQELGDVDKG